jgi:hypothetical protein
MVVALRHARGFVGTETRSQQMSITLPKLPHPVMNAMLGDDWEDLFTADQLRARDLEIVRLMLEATAQTCKQKAGRMRNMRDYAGGNALDHAAMLINELQVRHHE